ncbi:hypothetical protein ACLOJK_018442 [Asimina triloba]
MSRCRICRGRKTMHTVVADLQAAAAGDSSAGGKRLHATNDSIDDNSFDHGNSVAIIRVAAQKSQNRQ